MLLSCYGWIILSSPPNKPLAADGAIACFLGNLVPLSLNADCAPQLKAGVRRHLAPQRELKHAKNYLLEESQYKRARLTHRIFVSGRRPETECFKVRDGLETLGKDSRTDQILC